MARIYLDCEFIEDPAARSIDLVSIGACTDDPAAPNFYEISSEFDRARANPWVRANVLSILPPAALHPRRSNYFIAQAFRRYVETAPETAAQAGVGANPGPEFWGLMCGFDYVVVTWLMGGMAAWPEGWPYYFRDAQYALDTLRPNPLDPLYPRQAAGAHDALADALHIRALVQYLDTLQPSEADARIRAASASAPAPAPAPASS